MRVLHLDSGRELRGGQRQVLSLLPGLGAESVLLTPDNSPLMQSARDRGIDARPLNVAAISSLSRRMDLTHAHDARSHSWAAAVGGSPLVVSRRVAFPVGRSWLSRWKYRRASHYLAVSNFVAQSLVEAEVPEERITVVYDGVDIPNTAAMGTRIVALATRDPGKGRDLLERASVHCGLPIHFSDDLTTDMPTATIFVYITLSEGLGSAALMAMAHGVPVVASRVGGLPEIVREGQTGVLTENDPGAIANAIQRALACRQELAESARRCVEEGFRIEHLKERTMRVYQRVVVC